MLQGRPLSRSLLFLGGFLIGDSTGGFLATWARGEEAGAVGKDMGGAEEDIGADGALAGLYQINKHPVFATSLAGQAKTSQSTLMVSVIEFKRQGGFDMRRVIQSERQPQLRCSAVGNEEQTLARAPVYCAPQTAQVAFPFRRAAIRLSDSTARDLYRQPLSER